MDKLVQTALEVVELLKNDFSAAIQDIEQIVTTRKRDHTLVTELDFRIEKKIRQLLSIKTPNIPILGEEEGADDNFAGTGWVVDPVDGTRAFLYGMPTFGMLLSYVEEYEPIFGLMHFPAIDRTIYAMTGMGCFDKTTLGTIQVKLKRPVIPLDDAVISLSGLHSSDIYLADGSYPYKISNLIGKVKDLVFINDCYQHAMVATGRIDCAIDTLMKPWDSAAIIPCIREAGGVVSDIRGNTRNIINSGSLISASSNSILDRVLEKIS